MNRQLKIGTIFMVIGLAILCLGLAPSWAALLGNWTFDSCDGTDSSGNGYNGTLVGDPECVAGAVGKSLELDGDFNAGDYVNVGTSPAFNLTTFSICAWIYPFTDAQGHILSKKGSFDFGLDSNQQLSMGIWIGGGHWVGNTPDHTIPANQWTCVCGTYGPGEGGGMKFYINGQEAKSWTQTSNPNSTDNSVTIGYNSDAAGVHFWDGRLDEVRLYNHELSPGGVSTYCAAGPATCTCPDSDNDGVPDAWDDCPQTPEGMPTDSFGCKQIRAVVVPLN